MLKSKNALCNYFEKTNSIQVCRWASWRRSINSKYFSTVPQCDSDNLQAQGVKGTNMLLQSGLLAPTLSPPSSPPSGPLPLPLPHISTFQHPDTVTAGTRFHSKALAGRAASPASHDAVRPGLPHPRMSSMLKNVQLHHMALICEGSHAHFAFMCNKDGNDVQELFFLVGLKANNEHDSRVIVLLCKCEKITPVVYPAAGQRKGQGVPSGHQRRKKTESGARQTSSRNTLLSRSGNQGFYICTLVSDSRGERPEVSPAMTEI